MAAIAASAFLLFPNFLLQNDTGLVKNWISSVGLSLNALAAGLLLFASFGFPQGIRGTRIFSWMGRYSYGIYLWHIPVIVWIVKPWMFSKGYRPDPLTGTAIYLGVTILTGVLLTKLIEVPALKLRDLVCPDSTRHKPIARETTQTPADEAVSATATAETSGPVVAGR